MPAAARRVDHGQRQQRLLGLSRAQRLADQRVQSLFQDERVDFSPDFFPPLLIAASYCGRDSLGGCQQFIEQIAQQARRYFEIAHRFPVPPRRLHP